MGTKKSLKNEWSNLAVSTSAKSSLDPGATMIFDNFMKAGNFKNRAEAMNYLVKTFGKNDMGIRPAMIREEEGGDVVEDLSENELTESNKPIYRKVENVEGKTDRKSYLRKLMEQMSEQMEFNTLQQAWDRMSGTQEQKTGVNPNDLILMSMLKQQLGNSDNKDPLREMQSWMMMQNMMKQQQQDNGGQNNFYTQQIQQLTNKIDQLQMQLAQKGSGKEDAITTILLNNMMNKNSETKDVLKEVESIKANSMAAIEKQREMNQAMRDQLHQQEMMEMRERLSESGSNKGAFGKMNKIIEDKIQVNLAQNIDKLFGPGEERGTGGAITDLLTNTVERLGPTIGQAAESFGRGIAQRKQIPMGLPPNPPLAYSDYTEYDNMIPQQSQPIPQQPMVKKRIEDREDAYNSSIPDSDVVQVG